MLGLRRLVLGDRLLKGDAIGARVDGEQQVAFVNDLAVLKADRRENAADLGAQRDGIDGGELPEEAGGRGDRLSLPPCREPLSQI